MKCDACGCEKDIEALERYPWREEGFTKYPIPPLLNIDCQPGDERSNNPGEWKTISLCHACWHRLDPDMWTCQRHYEYLNPVTPYKELTNLYQQKD